jgi:hypothetical protein
VGRGHRRPRDPGSGVLLSGVGPGVGESLDNLFRGEVVGCADLDLDGFDDLLFTDAEEGTVSVNKRWLTWKVSGDGFGFESGHLQGFETGPSAVAVGNVQGGPARDVLVGLALEGVGGSVFLYTDVDGELTNDQTAALVQSHFGSAGDGADADFGRSLALADFDGDGIDDFAAGGPLVNHGGATDSGRVYVAYGPVNSGEQDEYQILGEDDFGASVSNDERFGTALAAGDVDRDGRDDLLVGAPGEGATDPGFVYILRGTASGLAPVGQSFFSDTTFGGTAQADAQFGQVLLLADLDGDGVNEVVVGVPLRDVGAAEDAGMVYVSRALDPKYVFGDNFESETPLVRWSASVGD